MTTYHTKIEHNVLPKNGYTIHYYSCGKSGKDLIIFLHPAFADHRSFENQIDFFSKEYRIVTIDLLGHGLSKVDKAQDKIDASVSHINTIMQTEEYSKAHFVGVSMGSLIAQYYGLKFPENVLSMTILGGYNINADNSEIAKAQRFEQLKWIFKALLSMNLFRKYVADVSLWKDEEKAKFYEMAKLFTRKSFMAMSGLGNVIKKRDGIETPYPLLILSGEYDIELAKKSSLNWHKSQPKSKYHVIEHAGHCANMDNPTIFNALLWDFINQKV